MDTATSPTDRRPTASREPVALRPFDFFYFAEVRPRALR